MRLIHGGSFAMGSEDFYPEESPVRIASVGDFWIDEVPVTNAQFGRFVRATGYVTDAERTPDPAEYPGLRPEDAVPGSLVFTPPATAPATNDVDLWWSFVPGACWHSPLGAGSDLAGKAAHPVVQVTYADAHAYAMWAGKALPSETEWEFAARGGLEGQPYAWGGELAPDRLMPAKIWSGIFPHVNLAPKGLERTAPVRSFPANGHGLHDMIGNVWELTESLAGGEPAANNCCGKSSPRSSRRRIAKGGSHLCAPNYCRRYRPAALLSQPEDTSTSHIGFRCIKRV
jgi:formylglycine-generating enzyme required for sulfatase activity